MVTADFEESKRATRRRFGETLHSPFPFDDEKE